MLGLHHLAFFVRLKANQVQDALQLLTKHKVKATHVTTLPYSDGNASQVLIMFTCSKAIQNDLLKDFDNAGFGRYGSDTDVSVLRLALAKDVRKVNDMEEGLVAAQHHRATETAQSVFQSTIKARIAVENTLEIVHEGASFSFDFFMLTLVAASLALIGLLTDSSVTLVASMLVSPMMGPILGITFGTVVRDKALIRTSAKTELICLCMCITVGYFGGLAAAPAAMRQYPWPTAESAARGDPSALYVNAAVAIPSGVGVALSIMGSNTNSLVGVAISASLLPPCVNTGLLWAEASLQIFYYQPTCESNGNNRTTWSTCCQARLAGPTCPTNTDYPDFCCTGSYYDELALGKMGGISMAITAVNVICIWIFGALTFLLKEVAPLPNKSELWTTLVPKARMFNRAVNKGEIGEDALTNEISRRALLPQSMPPKKIMKGGLQARTIGVATQKSYRADPTGITFPMQGGIQNRARAMMQNLGMVEQDLNEEEDDDDDEETARGDQHVS